jgi:hypothetical protein
MHIVVKARAKTMMYGDTKSLLFLSAENDATGDISFGPSYYNSH